MAVIFVRHLGMMSPTKDEGNEINVAVNDVGREDGDKRCEKVIGLEIRAEKKRSDKKKKRKKGTLERYREAAARQRKPPTLLT